MSNPRSNRPSGESMLLPEPPAVLELPIPEAAQRLGTSVATIRRRLQKGTLRGVKRELPTGFQWYVLLDDTPAPAAVSPVAEPASTSVDTAAAREVARLEEHVADLRRRVEDQAREISELHRLLANQQQLLLTAAQAATQPPTQVVEAASQVGTQVGSQDEEAATQPAQPGRRWWAWLWPVWTPATEG